MSIFDLTIIGGGPIGLFGAFYAGLRGMKVKIIDSLPQLGGQLTALYPEKFIYDMPGYVEIRAKDLSDKLIQQAMRFNPVVRLEQKICDLREEENHFVLLSDNNEEHKSKTVIIAAGAGAFAPKKHEAPGVSEFENRGVYYGVQQPEMFRNKLVVVVGGGDTAFDWALHLEKIAAKVILVHRRDRYRAHPATVQQVMGSSVELKPFNEIKSIHGFDRVASVTLFNNKTRQDETIQADAVIFNLGFSANIDMMKDWGIDITGNQIMVDAHMETTLPGVFSAGDVSGYEGKLRLIATGFGEVTTAVCFAHKRIDPSQNLFPGHSTDMDLFTAPHSVTPL